MNRLVLASALVLGPLAAVAAPGDAHADILSLRIEGHGGGAGGVGVGGAAKDESFFKGATGATYGGLIGLEVVFVDVWIDHHQFVKGGDLRTWTNFMTGIDLDFEIRDQSPAPDKGESAPEGKQKGYVELGIGVGYGVGTGQQVEPPLDASELSDKGFLLEGKFGAGLVLGGVIGLGVSVPVSVGYFFKTGFANDAETQYTSVQGAVLLVVRGKIKIK